MKLKTKISKSQNIKDRFRKLLTSKTEEERIKRDSYILMANYLYEIERLYDDIGLKRKALAQKIDISPSYLTQVFRGYKPLNFLTLAKIKRALNLRFDVKASFKSEKKIDFEIDAPIYTLPKETQPFRVIMGDKKLEASDYKKYS
jgi:ribosome-binding protein aMBF1 (putative translation factor)